MAGSITPKGTGFPDYSHRPFGTLSVSVRSGSVEISGTIEHIRRIGTVGYLGTQRYLGRVGTVGKITTGSLGHVTVIGSVARVGRLGTVAGLGTLRYVQAGSLGRVERIGTVGQVGRVGTAHVGTVPTESFGRRGVYTAIRGNVRLGAGSVWLGSWQHVGSYAVKTLVFSVGNPGTSGGGSVAIITGLPGTSVGQTGTYFGPMRVGKGTYTPLSFTEAVRYVRPWIRQHGDGAVAAHGGTVTFNLGVRP